MLGLTCLKTPSYSKPLLTAVIRQVSQQLEQARATISSQETAAAAQQAEAASKHEQATSDARKLAEVTLHLQQRQAEQQAQAEQVPARGLSLNSLCETL